MQLPAELSVVINPVADTLLPTIANGAVSLIGGALAAIIGGVVGSKLTAKANRDQADSAREALDDARHKANAFAVHFKLIAIYSAARQYHEQLGGSRIRKAGSGAMFRCAGHKPFSSDGQKIYISADELSTLHEIGGDGLLNGVASLDAQHNSLRDNFAMYRQQWFIAHEGIKIVQAANGVATLELTREEMIQVAPKFMMLDDLLAQMDDFVLDMERSAYKVLVALLHARFKKFGTPSRLMTIDLRGKPVTIVANADEPPLEVRDTF
ncbi:hypothetical protein D3C73_316110 [compost metagenome]